MGHLYGLLPTPASIAQGIEHRFPKPCVAGSNPARGTTVLPCQTHFRSRVIRFRATSVQFGALIGKQSC